MESRMLRTLGFDFNFSNPEHFIDRYLRITGYQFNKDVNQSAVQIMTLHFIDEGLMKFPISKIAASSVILAINIYKLKEKFLHQLVKDQECLTSEQLEKFQKLPKPERFFKRAY